MYGKSVGKLSVYIRTQDGGGWTEKWSRSGSIGQFWERFDLRIGSYFSNSKSWQVIIEAQASNNTRDDGVIAIDDISFDSNCKAATDPLPTIITTTRSPVCGSTGFKCSNNNCINQTQVCDFIIDCPNGEDEKNCGSCDFEMDYCGWYDNSYGDHFWNKSVAGDTLISYDHTLGTPNGSFAFYELSDGAFNGLSRLFTPKLGRTGSHCEFKFYFFKQDVFDRSILLTLFLVDKDNYLERLWKTDANSINNDWQPVTVGLHSRFPGFKLYFEASHISDVYPFYKPMLAIDDTSFINCGISNNVSCLASNVFKCDNKQCIPNNLVCDFSGNLLKYFLVNILS
jgi:hypothetical protein